MNTIEEVYRGLALIHKHWPNAYITAAHDVIWAGLAWIDEEDQETSAELPETVIQELDDLNWELDSNLGTRVYRHHV